MPRIVDIENVVPEHAVPQSKIAAFVKELFPEFTAGKSKLMDIFENTSIENRYLAAPLEWFKEQHTFAERNERYVSEAIRLCSDAITGLLRRRDLPADKIHHIFFVSTTGISTPSIDAFLFNELGLNQFIRRTPIWGLGCAGGVAGIARACDWLKAYPEKNALVVSVELCSLTFVRQDLSKSNLIATSLFGDGASAVLLCGDRSKIRSDRMLRVLFSDSITWRNTLDVMGWDVGENGLSVVFSKSIPSITMEFARPAIVQFLTRHNLGLSDIAVLLSHPGGPKIIAALERALEMTDAQTRYMRSVQSKYGNMSSTTVLFVLNEFMRSQEFRPGMKLLSSSLGPGFSMESFVAESE